MRIRVRLFGSAAESAGESSATVNVVAGALVKDVVSTVAQKFPSLSSQLSSVRFAIGTRYVRLSDELKEGDIVSIIPPVGGG